VKVRDNNPAHVDPKQVADAVRFHHAFFTTAPFVRLLVNGGSIGDIVPARGGKAHAEVIVQAAPWVSVSRVTLYLNGQEIQRWAVPAGTDPNRFHAEMDVTTLHDGYVVARVDGDKPLSPVVGDGKTFTAYPFALTNPVFLDVDGDGKYRTGLPHNHGAVAPSAKTRK